MITVPLCMSDALQLCTTPVQYRIFSFCLSSLRILTLACCRGGGQVRAVGGRVSAARASPTRRRSTLSLDRYRTLSAIQNGIITVRTKVGCDCAAHVLSLVSSTQDMSEVSQSSHGHARPSLDPRQAASPLPALQAAAPREQ